jgi:hypothetical protein
MIRVLRKLWKLMFTLKRKQQLPRLPRGFTTEYDRKVSYAIEKVLSRSNARSPDGVDRLLRQKGVETIDALLPLLPDMNRKIQPLDSLGRWLMRLHGTTAYEPVITPVLRRMRQRRRQTLIRRTPYSQVK